MSIDFEFIDPRWVEHTYFLERQLSAPSFPHSAPIFRDTSVGTVLPRPEGGLAMWYQSLEPRLGKNLGFNSILRYAESADGLNWSAPDLGLREPRGEGPNNILIGPDDVDEVGAPLTGFVGTEFVCVVDAELTPHPHARGRYTALYLSNPPQGGGLYLAFSEDGLRWLAYPENPVYRGWPDTFNIFFHDERIGRYVLYLRPGVHAGPTDVNRLVARAESDDLVHWHLERIVLDTDERDAPAVGTVKDGGDWQGPDGYPRGRDRQFYGLAVRPYAGIYLGLAPVLDAVSGKVWLELLHSFDGIDWRREPGRRPFIKGPVGHWHERTTGFAAAGAPVRLGDSLLFYHSGSNMLHLSDGTLDRYMNDWLVERKDSSFQRGIGLATVPRGRLASYVAGSGAGELLTTPFVLEESSLHLNVDAARGEIRVAITDETGRPFRGFGRDDSKPVTRDDLSAAVQFGSKSELSQLVGQVARLRIYAENAEVFGFRMG